MMRGVEPTPPARTCPKCGGGLQPADDDRAICFSCRSSSGMNKRVREEIERLLFDDGRRNMDEATGKRPRRG